MGELNRLAKKAKAATRAQRALLRGRTGDTGVTTDKRETPLVVTLTSYPPRFRTLRPCLETLLQQRCRPDRIVLWLSRRDSSPKHLPAWLTTMTTRGLELRFVSWDYGPYDKLYPTLRDTPESILVTADDDMLYPADWLARLYSTHRAHPREVICWRAYRIPLDRYGESLPYAKWRLDHRLSSSPYLFPTGCSGVLYPPNSLDDIALDMPLAQRLAPHADDIWWKAAAILRGTGCRKVEETSVGFPQVLGSQRTALFRRNLRQGGNDAKLAAVFSYFGLRHRLSVMEQRARSDAIETATCAS